jgi:MoxR-like ATPase
MTHDWHITLEDHETAGRWKALPQPAMLGLSSPAGYRPKQDTVDAVNVSLTLGQPLLITGEPGCGKTTLADWVAFKLGLQRSLRFQTRSNSTARDLFYYFDAVGRFHAAQTGRDADPRNFIEYRAMGEAVMRALGRDHVSPFVSPSRAQSYGASPTRSVVLIDEIDKAPRDFPNDLLGELERFGFEIPELGIQEVNAPSTLPPIVIVTSNVERSLPDAFLRRCVFHHLEFPDDDLLRDIITLRIASMPRSSGLVSDAIKVIRTLRDARLSIRKPGTAELLAFVLMLRQQGYNPSDRLAGRNDWIPVASITMVKSLDSAPEAERVLQRFAAERLN